MVAPLDVPIAAQTRATKRQSKLGAGNGTDNPTQQKTRTVGSAQEAPGGLIDIGHTTTTKPRHITLTTIEKGGVRRHLGVAVHRSVHCGLLTP